MNWSKEKIVNCFEQSSYEVAKFISKLEDYKGNFESITNQTLDNADPLCEAQTCLERLGVLLATLVIYKNEYAEDLKSEK